MPETPIPQPNPEDLTLLLRRGAQGDAESEARFVTMVYNEMRKLARKHMRSEKRGGTLQTTALVHEAYLRLFQKPIDWQDRSHFFAIASQTMHRILVDYARASLAEKRYGGIRTDIEEARFVSDDRLEHILEMDEPLRRFATLYPRQSKVVELHVFVGLTFQEISAVLGPSDRTIKRDWDFAKAWLFEAISGQRSS
jgi:RNA polymerase sigma factor (TIGR02999 family)